MSGINIPITIKQSNNYFEDELIEYIRAGNTLKKFQGQFQEEDRDYSIKGTTRNYSSSLSICQNEMYGSFGPLTRNQLEFLSRKIMVHEDTYWYNFEDVLLMENPTSSNQ